MPNFYCKIPRLLVVLTALCLLAFTVLAVPAAALEGAGLPSDMGSLTGPRYTPRASDDTVGADGTNGTDTTAGTGDMTDTTGSDNTDSTDSTDSTNSNDNTDVTDDTDISDSADITDTTAIDTDITESFDSDNANDTTRVSDTMNNANGSSDSTDAAQDDFAVWGIFIVLLVIAGVAVLILALMPKKRKK